MTHDPDRILDLFHHAAGLPASERKAFIDENCGDDMALRKKLESLLANMVSDDTVQYTPPGSDELVANDTIGPYTILSTLGEGGMGVVYLAQQQEPIRRKVAVKVIKAGMDSKAVIARFEAERQALALMNHPGISSVYEAGMTGNGLPYFVMEYVEGKTITEACDRNELDTNDRLVLMAEVCDAVQHAHLKGVIHRDLKPGNILVFRGDDGRLHPKIIDFGIAKATSQDLSETPHVTQHGQVVGTLAYMAPEQADARADDIDALSDVYALGVVLYEVLAGRPPFPADELHKAGMEEMRRIICEEDPPRPSTWLSTTGGEEIVHIAKSRQTEVASLARTLRRELQWIPLRALKKERGERYGSARDMAEDIRRYLDGMPLEAGPESAMYRFRKTVRRNKGAFAAIAIIMLILIAGVVVSLSFAIEAHRQRQVAQDKEQIALKMEHEAEVARERAEEERAKTETALVEAARAAYDGRMSLAASSLSSGDRTKALEYLKHAESVDEVFDPADPPMPWLAMHSAVSNSIPGMDDVEFAPYHGSSDRSYVDGMGTNWPSNTDTNLVAASMHKWDENNIPRSELVIYNRENLGDGNLGIIHTLSSRPAGEGAFSASWTSDDALLMVLRAKGNREANTVIECWNPATGELAWQNEIGKLTYKDKMHFRGDGTLLAVLEGATIVVLDATNGNVLHRLHADEDVTSIAFDPSSIHIASGGTNGMVRMWDLSSGETKWELEALGGIGTAMFSSDGSILQTRTNDVVPHDEYWTVGMKQWDMDREDVLEIAGIKQRDTELQQLAVDNIVNAIHAQVGLRPGSPAQVSELTMSPYSFHVASIEVEEIKPDTGENPELQTLAGLPPSVQYTNLFAPRPQFNSTISIQNILDGSPVHVLQFDKSIQKSVAFSPDGRHMAVAMPPGTHLSAGDKVMQRQGLPGIYEKSQGPSSIRIYDIQDRAWIEEHQIPKPDQYYGVHPVAISYSPDGSSIATLSNAGIPTRRGEGFIHVIDVSTGEMQQQFSKREWLHQRPEEKYTFSNLAYSPDGSTLAVSDNFNRILFIDLLEGNGFSPEMAIVGEDIERFGFGMDGSILIAVTAERFIGWDPAWNSKWDTEERDPVIDIPRTTEQAVLFTRTRTERFAHYEKARQELAGMVNEVDEWMSNHDGDDVSILVEMEAAGRDDTHVEIMKNLIMLKSIERLEEPIDAATEMLDSMRTTHGPEHPKTLEAMIRLGYAFYKQGRYKEALPYYTESVAGHRRVLGNDDPATLWLLYNMGSVLYKQRKYDDALPYYTEALDGRRRVLGDEDPKTLDSIFMVGAVLRMQGKNDEAMVYYIEVLEGRRSVLGMEHPETRAALKPITDLIKHYRQQKNYDKAAEYMRMLGSEDEPTTAPGVTTTEEPVVEEPAGEPANAAP